MYALPVHGAEYVQEAAMDLLPPQTNHAGDRALHDDVRWLGSILGRVIRKLEGEKSFEAVERLRMACRARRKNQRDAPALDELLDFSDNLDLETATQVARAFALFFVLINTAEQVHRVRCRQSHSPPRPGEAPSFPWALERLKERGHGAEEVLRVLSKMEVRPVLTAHPTEPTRHTILDLQTRIAKTLLSMDRKAPSDRKGLRRAARHRMR